MVYYGLSLNASKLSGDIYLNFFLLAIVELASYIFCLVLLDKAGRKFLQSFSMLLGGVACIATMFPVMFGSGGKNHDLGVTGAAGVSMTPLIPVRDENYLDCNVSPNCFK